MIRQARRFLADRHGTTAIEYAIIAAGVAGAILATITALGGSVTTLWTSVKDALG
jgi:pilus assembly protein Flp/PilA